MYYHCQHVDTDLDKCVLAEYIGDTEYQSLQLHKACLKSKFMTSDVTVGIVDRIPVEGLQIVLGNNIAGGQVSMCPVLSLCGHSGLSHHYHVNKFLRGISCLLPFPNFLERRYCQLKLWERHYCVLDFLKSVLVCQVIHRVCQQTLVCNLISQFTFIVSSYGIIVFFTKSSSSLM